VRPATSRAASAPRSKGFGLDPHRHRQPPGHGREERDLPHALERRVEVRELLIERNADRGKIHEGRGIALLPRAKLLDQFGDRGGLRLDPLLRQADPFAHPGEVEHVDHGLSFRYGRDLRK
jgi:hypothetical protein